MRRTAAASALALDQAESSHPSFDRDYWLAHCEGYRVESPAGGVGIVEEVIPPSDDRPGLLAVRGGLLGQRLLLVPTSDVAVVVPRSLRLILRSAEGVAMTARREAKPILPTLDDELLGRVARRDFRCAGCGYGAVAAAPPARCPMCGGASWTQGKELDPTTYRRQP